MNLRPKRNRQEYALVVESLEPRVALSGSPPALGTPHLAAGSQTGTGQGSYSSNLYDDVRYAHTSLRLSGVGQTVAVIDSGVAYDHHALGSGLGNDYRVVGGWDFTEQDSDPYDDGPIGFHGTHIAGIIASDDAVHTGVAPSVDVVGLRVFNDYGESNFDWIEAALHWVHTHRNSFRNPITTVNLSLGSQWNSTEVPDWSRLEDEFAQLERDGLFVAVSAGNAFAPEDSILGLSYPAASQHVVPVASSDAAGQLSKFSQRHGRILAALGENVTSTAPDYLFGFDGVTDDFVAISGTSTAAPFVAGTAVLLREAFERIGMEDIDQAALYKHLRETADVVYDPITEQDFHRINIRRALDTALDAASGPQLDPVIAATDFGTVSRIEVAVSPSDGQGEWFRWTAAENAVLKISSGTADSPSTNAPVVIASDGSELAAEKTSRTRESTFIHADRGQSFLVSVSRPGTDTMLCVEPLLEFNNTELTVHGEGHSESVVVRMGSDSLFTVRGMEYQMNPTRWKVIESQITPDNVSLSVTTRAASTTVRLSLGGSSPGLYSHRALQSATAAADFAPLYVAARTETGHGLGEWLSFAAESGPYRSTASVVAVFQEMGRVTSQQSTSDILNRADGSVAARRSVDAIAAWITADQRWERDRESEIRLWQNRFSHSSEEGQGKRSEMRDIDTSGHGDIEDSIWPVGGWRR